MTYLQGLSPAITERRSEAPKLKNIYNILEIIIIENETKSADTTYRRMMNYLNDLKLSADFVLLDEMKQPN